ncbi:UNVERIFIED_CONTAM: hypothetical protein HDU68_007200 [Siphonaria sp. JEL0065]|nr:hypothetical protein HDU68_007200 [Siphonaria sp. JEL0065]
MQHQLPLLDIPKGTQTFTVSEYTPLIISPLLEATSAFFDSPMPNSWPAVYPSPAAEESLTKDQQENIISDILLDSPSSAFETLDPHSELLLNNNTNLPPLPHSEIPICARGILAYAQVLPPSTSPSKAEQFMHFMKLQKRRKLRTSPSSRNLMGVRATAGDLLRPATEKLSGLSLDSAWILRKE